RRNQLGADGSGLQGPFLVPPRQDVQQVADGTPTGVGPLVNGEDHAASLVLGVHVVVAPQPDSQASDGNSTSTLLPPQVRFTRRNLNSALEWYAGSVILARRTTG